MKGCIDPKKSDRTDLLDIFLYIHTCESHIHGQGIFVIFYTKQCFYMSIIVFFVIGVLAVSCKAGCVLGDLGRLLSLGTVIFLMLSVQFGLEPFRMGESELAPAFSSRLPTCTPCNIITVPVLSGGTSHYSGMWVT